MAQDRGGFTLFGLFEMEEPTGNWDLIAAAPWLGTNRNAIQEIIESVSAHFSVEDWQIIAAVVPMEPSSDFVRAITRKYRFEHQVEEIGTTYVDGLYISHAILITSNPSPSPAPAARQPVAI